MGLEEFGQVRWDNELNANDESNILLIDHNNYFEPVPQWCFVLTRNHVKYCRGGVRSGRWGTA